MKLHENQLKLLRHLAQFNQMDYPSCLKMLDMTGTKDRTALSYAFRPLTKNRYLSKRKDGCVSILAKGRALFPEITPLISTGGGSKEARRVMEVSRMAALMKECGVPASGEIPDDAEPCFIPSACWRNIAPGILSTTRFTGMLVAGDIRLAVYDIGDGDIEWQVRAEGSLFYSKYGSYETKASGMLLVCREDMREQIAQNIIRHTMWHRRRLLRDSCIERNKPTRWSRSPIVSSSRYEHVYLTTPERLSESLERIWDEDDYIDCLCEDGGIRLGGQGVGDVKIETRRLFVNPACDLLKYVRFFSAAKTYLEETENDYIHYEITLELYIYPEDRPVAEMYPKINELEGLSIYVYKSQEDTDSN